MLEKKADELTFLQGELLNLFQYIQRVRREVAAINRAEEGDRFDNMSDQLDAIVKATSDATNSIMDAVEQSEDLMRELRNAVTDNEKATKILDKMEMNTGTIYEACSFQDITGQRVTKIARSITYVEARVNSLIELFGKEELEKLDVGQEEKTEDEKLLAGPQLEGQGVTQDEIDKLFD